MFNSCPAVFIRVGISIQKPVDSQLDKTRPVALKKWSCLIFNVQDLNFANFLPIFENTLFSKNDIGDLMKMYGEEEGIMSQPRKILISSFTLQNGILITPLLLFYLHLGLVVTKTHRFVEYIPKKGFNGFAQ